MRPALDDIRAPTNVDAPGRAMCLVEAAYTALETWLPVTLLAAAALLGLVTIVLRYGFGIGFAWAQGVLILMTVIAAYLACSGAVHTDEHIRFDLILNRVPPRARYATKAFVNLLIVAFLGLVVVLVVRFLRFQVKFGGTSLDTYLPDWVPPLGVAVAIAMMTLRYLQYLVQAVVAALRAAPPRTPS